MYSILSYAEMYFLNITMLHGHCPNFMELPNKKHHIINVDYEFGKANSIGYNLSAEMFSVNNCMNA